MNTKNIVTKEIQTYFHLFFMPGFKKNIFFLFIFLMAFRLEIHVSYNNEFERNYVLLHYVA